MYVAPTRVLLYNGVMGIEFENDTHSVANFTSRTVLGQPQVPGMAAWLMRKGVIKEESEAKTVLLGIMCFNFIVMGLVLYFFVI